LLSVLAAMAHKPLIASNVTVGALFRAIDTCRPALFIDEADTFLAGNGTMRGIINSGNTWRTAYVLRLSRAKEKRGREEHSTFDIQRSTFNEGTVGRQDARATTEGETGLKRYSCWCPKVIAMIGRVPDTIGDRSIVVQMSRKLVSEACAPLSELNALEIRAKCVRFALDAGPAIAQAAKVRVEGLNDRAADTFDPLYVIARLAGGGWEEKLHKAALGLTAAAQLDNAGPEILLDVLSAFIMTCRDKLFASDLADVLRGGIVSPALDYSSINEHQISAMLRPYGIKTSAIRVGKVVQRGYVENDFRDALIRYVPRAELEARMEELRRSAELQAEAKIEADAEAKAKAEQEAAMMKEREKEKRTESPHGYGLSQRQMGTLMRKLGKNGLDDDIDDETDGL
jgi:hypothetical protein